MACQVRRGMQVCQGLVALVPLVILVPSGHRCQVYAGFLDKKGSRDKAAYLVNLVWYRFSERPVLSFDDIFKQL